VWASASLLNRSGLIGNPLFIHPYCRNDDDNSVIPLELANKIFDPGRRYELRRVAFSAYVDAHSLGGFHKPDFQKRGFRRMCFCANRDEGDEERSLNEPLPVRGEEEIVERFRGKFPTVLLI
jgi:hypothetical protein